MNAVTTRLSVAIMATTVICTSPLATIASSASPAIVPKAMPANMKVTPKPKTRSALSSRRRDASANNTQVRMSNSSYPTLMSRMDKAACVSKNSAMATNPATMMGSDSR
uniref:hypothetical protein n=1 Tax=Gordonibacter sp. An230 TaxID=1965592 RepID=UPI001EF5C98B|nr:hypothetical protein [Gordonibacter sp. An230]